MRLSKIAIFRALYLGDMLCIIPTIRAIRKAHPAAEIFLIGLPWQKDFAERFAGYFDHFIEFPGWPGLPEQQPDPEKVLQFVEKIRTFNFDIIFQMQGNGEVTNSMCMLWGGHYVCGLRKPGEYAPDERLFPVSTDGEHEILRFFKLLDAVGIAPQGEYLEFPVMEKEAQNVRQLMETSQLQTKQYVCIHPGARDVRRRWPVENFAAIASPIATQGFPIVLTGSADEKSLLSELEEKIEAPVINIVETFGHLTAGELAALIGNAALLVSNDTGVSHIAAALKTPSVILFSPYSAIHRWRPLDTKKHLSIPTERTQDTRYVLELIFRMLQDQIKMTTTAR